MLEVKKTYTFSVLTDLIPLLGAKHSLMKVVAILTADNALRYGDIYTLHNQILGFVKSLPSNCSELTYLLLEKTNKEQLVLAYEYIDEKTIKEVTSIDLQVTIRNCSNQDIQTINKLLKEAGYATFTLKTLT